MESNSVENYLKAIYLAGDQKNEKVSVTLLAGALGNNPASIIDMLKKLMKKKLVKYDKKNGAILTSAGLKSALQTIRKHRLWELFLKEKLGYTWEEVHDIAEQLEHVQNESLADRLDAFLNFPLFDPHGEAIPKSDGKMPMLKNITLVEVETGKNYEVASVKDTSKEILEYLTRLSISLGTKIKVVERIRFDDSLIILVDDKDQTLISRKLAEYIFVKG